MRSETWGKIVAPLARQAREFSLTPNRSLDFHVSGSKSSSAEQSRRCLGVDPMSGMKSILIGALIVAVAVLGYLYYQGRQNTIEIKLPNVSIEKK